jgi:hypothetical protein
MLTKIAYFIKGRIWFLCFLGYFIHSIAGTFVSPWNQIDLKQMFAVSHSVFLQKRAQYRQNLCRFTNSLLTREQSYFFKYHKHDNDAKF